jgi:predicted RNase H-like HicB family nuclease
MRYFSFEIVIEKEPEDEGYFAYSPTIPGCFSNGKSIEQTKRNIREATAQHIESQGAGGEVMPQHDSVVNV